MDEVINKCYQDLANGIVLQAVEDWRMAIKSQERLYSRLTIEEIERFFLSDWFMLLTNVDGAGLLQTLKKETGLK